MEKKKIQSSGMKLLSKEGSFQAIFSRFNEVDKQGDITLPGAFEDGEQVKIAAWGHDWGSLPVGRGVIHQDGEKAWVDGEFFLDTEAGFETYKTIKNLGDLAEWSYGFDILDSEHKDGYRILKKLQCFEVSPVLVGAGNRTMTQSIKSHGSQNAKALLLEIQSLKRWKEYRDMLDEIRQLR
jgi:HK97 family phage prohead protease